MEGQVVSKEFILYYNVSIFTNMTVTHMLTMFCIYKRDRLQKCFSNARSPQDWHRVTHQWDEVTGRKFLDDLATKVNILSPHDWHRVTLSDIRMHGGSELLTKYGTLFNMFSSIYPEYLFD